MQILIIRVPISLTPVASKGVTDSYIVPFPISVRELTSAAVLLNHEGRRIGSAYRRLIGAYSIAVVFVSLWKAARLDQHSNSVEVAVGFRKPVESVRTRRPVIGPVPMMTCPLSAPLRRPPVVFRVVVGKIPAIAMTIAVMPVH